MSELEKLSHDDIKALLSQPDTSTKIKVIEKLSGQYNASDFTEAQVQLAEQIFRLLLKQAEIEVRKALADNLMHSMSIPHDVVFSLARDVEEVSLPVLEFSEVLTDSDLIEIIKSTEVTASQVAVANRENVSESVSHALVETHNQHVVGTLLNNNNARIADNSYEMVLDDFSNNEIIVDSMITRGSLSSHIVEQMTEKVSSAIQNRLEEKYESSFKDVNGLFRDSGEIAAFKIMGMQRIDDDLVMLVDKLEKSGEIEESLDPVYGTLSQLLDGIDHVGQLTPLSALAIGHLTLFNISMSRLTSVPYSNVKKLVEEREGGISALYHRAQLPPKLFEAVAFVVEVIKNMDREFSEGEGAKARDDLHIFVKNIIVNSKGRNIPNLAHFISVVRHHIDQ